MTDPTEPEPRLVNRTSDLPIPATEKRDRFEHEGDACGALAWRTDQVRNLLDALDHAVRDRDPRWQKHPQPPRWSDVARATGLLARLAEAALVLGLYRDTAEARELLGVEVADASSPTCGHSACRQHWIDTGRSECVAEEDT